ncbi:flagellar filament capping protein FliD [Cellvibrio sp. ARAG 10.3]|uniref:flagellar filament capping protein FliD n=1 Tax=Cellvibrio sp. ARAG 10.3 TaxID=3451358 RepID=UPI003F46C865
MVDSTSSSTTTNPGSSIINSLGGGSGIDSASLIKQLVEINKAPELNRLTSRQTLLETQISDFGLLRSSFATLQTAANALASPDTFNAKAVSIPDTSLLGITKLDAKAVAGDYRLKVEQIAQAQSLSSGSYSSVNDAVGKGTLTLRFGSWNEALDEFSVNTAKSGATITIDDTNNTLSGLRDAINKADIGVQATIVSDGGSYKLLLTAPSGEANEIELTATEDGDAPGLANFNFNTANQALAQEQGGANALIRVNGLLLTRESNHLTDVIDGMEFDIFNSSTTETVSINISADKSIAETAIRDFVSTYNTFLGEVEKLVGFNEELGEYGSLRQDPLAKNLLQSIRSMMTGSVAGITNGFDSLSTLGIRTELNGTLKIVENGTNTDFRAAIDKNFEAVRDLFTPKTSSSNSLLDVTAFSRASQPGNYEVVITQQPEKGRFVADAMSFPIDTTGKDYSFNIVVDGKSAATITLPDGKVYASGTELAAEMQSLINLDSEIKNGRVGVQVAFNTNTNQLEFTSNAYGAASNVSFTSVGADMADLGISAGIGTAGKDVAGTVDGVTAFGFGNILLPAIGSKAEGLSMVVTPGVTNATIGFSRGFAGQMDSLINDFLKNSGLIKGRETNINKEIDNVEEDMEQVERRSEAYRLRLQSQFIAMESIVRSLNNTGSFLDGLVDRLPFTSKNN